MAAVARVTRLGLTATPVGVPHLPSGVGETDFALRAALELGFPLEAALRLGQELRAALAFRFSLAMARRIEFGLMAALEAAWSLQIVEEEGIREVSYNMTTKITQMNEGGLRLVVQMLDQDGVAIDLTLATGLKIRLGKPDGTGVEFAAALVTDGLDGKIVYVTAQDDLDQAGDWTIQGLATIDAEIKYTELGPMVVKENVPDPAP